MLKALVGALVAANLAFFAWSEGAFDDLIGVPAWRSTGEREPERLKRQVNAERIRVLSPGAASQAAALPKPPPPTVCLEAGPFAAGAELDTARAAVLDIVPAEALAVLQADQPAAWGVYMGRYASQGALQRKEDELRRRSVSFDEITAPEALAPGLVLGRYPEREATAQALAELVARGVRGARVVQLVDATSASRLRVARVDVATGSRLKALADGATLAGKAFGDCTAPP